MDKTETKVALTPTIALTPDKILQRIRVAKEAVDVTSQKLRRQKMTLHHNTYLYVEAMVLDGDMTPQDVYRSLTSEVGANPGYWARARRLGEFIELNEIDPGAARLGAVSMIAYSPGSVIPRDHLKKLCAAINAGAKSNDVRNMLIEMGHDDPRPTTKVSSLAKARIREWSDWEPELEDLCARIGSVTDKEGVVIALELHVNGKSQLIANHTT